VVAALTILPVIGVPVMGSSMMGLDSLLSIVQMPGGIPVATMAVGKAGAKNAGLFAVAILSRSQPALRDALVQFRQEQAAGVLAQDLPPV
jgi:5-(carboxyamino)imidazole ribonucleotide mutase